MKKSQMTRCVLKVLKKWENSTPSPRMANKIIDVMVEAGMLPPRSQQRDLGCECGCKGWCPKGHDWDYEHMPAGSMQTPRNY
jgi:hypothetical protein